jgi:cytosine/adenosine deaminase-related metal-dependent hydrolase
VLAVAVSCDVGEGDSSKPLPVGVSSEGGSGVGGEATGGGGGSGTGGFVPGSCEGPGPAVETAGVNTRYLLKGMLLLPAGPMPGELLIENNTITCAAASCAGEPGASGATVVQTNGIISPGLIDGHNHILFDIFDETDWSPPMIYTNHNQWPNDAKYGAMVDAKQYLNGEMGSPLDLGCELLKWGELKALIAGTTSVQGSPGTGRGCFGSVARSIDISQNDLPDDNMQTATIFPSTSSADGVCTNFGDGDTNAYVIHIGEGVDTTARDEFDDLNTVTTMDGCLYDPRTAIVHGTALDASRLMTMATNQMSIIWSPRSNVFLYGGGTDFTKTTDIPTALGLGILVALAPDWSIGGSQNMLDEMRFANQVDDAQFGNLLDARTLWQMSTSNAAVALGVEQYIGTLEVGKRADIAVFCPSQDDPFDSILSSSPREVTAVFVDGRLLYGDESLMSAAPPSASCETADICTRPKFFCIAETGGNPSDRLDQAVTEIEQILEQAMLDYDNMNLTQWDFAPIAPLVKCP